MSFRFTVLASGSGGNSSLVQSEGFGLLLDIGIGPKQLGGRLAEAGHCWDDVHAAILTHTHCDHWRDASLAHLLRRRIPLWCYREHPLVLLRDSTTFALMRAAGLVELYESDVELQLGAHLRCRPIAVRHDGGPTFGFRIEGKLNGQGSAPALGYVADLGCGTPQLAEALADVDLLALEFNHDVRMQRLSNRPALLIARVLSDHGHLSNEQAAQVLREVILRSRPGRVRHLVQLHLSRECNRRELAAATARRALAELDQLTEVLTAEQDRPLPTIVVEPGAGRCPTEPDFSRRQVKSDRGAAASLQAFLPGFEV